MLRPTTLLVEELVESTLSRGILGRGGWPSFAHQSWRRPTLRAVVESRDILYILSLDILYSGGEDWAPESSAR